ncbi:MAG: hypothetical protein ACOH5I_12265 [Oligoflexus sp.]
MSRWLHVSILAIFSLSLTGCPLFNKEDKEIKPGEGSLVQFVGVDVSGSFVKSKHYRDSLKFLANYLYSHLHGLGGMRVQHSLFVGTIGGAKKDQPKTFYPIQTFMYKNVPEIEKQLLEIFPPNKIDPHTDFNAFFEQIALYMRNKKLVMKPTDIILLTDGFPDSPRVNGKHDYRSIKFDELENLTRNITVRVLYTSAETGHSWQTEIPRKRVRVWTQDAKVMSGWNNTDIFLQGKAIEEQERFFKWVQDNVNFPVRVKRVR